MREILKIMISTFQETKASGSYVLFYFLALGLGLAVAWDRYSKTKMEDNWMLEKAVLVPKFPLYHTERLAIPAPSPRGHTESGVSNAVGISLSPVVGNGH